jgi:K+/H+ antiporter YhaU regulatory subunit KhtT
MHFNPSPDDVIEPGDCLIAMGQPARLRELEKASVLP